MKKIGLTGGIGSGKSVVARILTSMGYPVYYSDTQSKILTDTDPEIRSGLIRMFGSEIYSDSGLNRPFLAKEIFSDDSKRLAVNQLIHPRVRLDFDNWVAKQKADFVFNEAAILFETGGYKQFDYTILVTAPIALRLERVVKRDSTSRAEALARIEKQWPDEQKIPLADFILINDDQTPLIVQVEELLEKLKKN